MQHSSTPLLGGFSWARSHLKDGYTLFSCLMQDTFILLYQGQNNIFLLEMVSILVDPLQLRLFYDSKM